MPELPEVETIKNKLTEHIVGQTISKISVLHPKSFLGDSSKIIGASVTKVSRRAKLIRIHLSDDQNLLVHLKMTGQLIFVDGDTRVGGGHPTADWVQELPSRHTRIVFEFESGVKLFFNDQRIFGWVKLMDDNEIKEEYEKYGPDIIDQSLTSQYLFDNFQRRRIPIKQAIMMNPIVAGIGNIYACDALNLAKIDPHRSANSLNQSDVDELFEAAVTVINRGIDMGGATIDDYRNVDGFAGKYQDVVLVYGREGKPCGNCGAKVLKTKIGGRGTYYCAGCQK